MLVVSGGIIPRAEPYCLVSGQSRVLARALGLASEAEVVRELVEPRRNAARGFPLERGGGSAMKQASPSRDHGFVQRFLHEGVRECVGIAFARSLLSEQLVRDELLQDLNERFLVDAEHLAQIVERDSPPDDCSGGQGFECARAERVDPSEDRFAHRRGKARALERPSCAVVRYVERDPVSAP